MTGLTAIILTKDEEKNITECLESLKGLTQRIIVVDSGSTDNTIKIANTFGVDVYTHQFENYSKQFNWAIDNTNIKTKWTLRIDADERITPALSEELKTLMIKHKDDDINGITMEAWLYFMGKKIKYGGPKKRKLMVFKTGIGKIEDRNMDEHTILSFGKSVSAKEKFLHYDFKDLNFFINKLNWYASREIKDYFEYQNCTQKENLNDTTILAIRRKKFGFYYKLPIFIRSWFLFIYFYVFKLGFLDGKEGFIYHYLYQRWYRLIIDAKIYEYKINNK